MKRTYFIRYTRKGIDTQEIRTTENIDMDTLQGFLLIHRQIQSEVGDGVVIDNWKLLKD